LVERETVTEHWQLRLCVGDVVMSDYRSVGVAGSLAGGRVTSGSRQRDTSARDTRGSTRNSAAAAADARPHLLTYLLSAAAAAAAASTVMSGRAAAIRTRRCYRLL